MGYALKYRANYSFSFLTQWFKPRFVRRYLPGLVASQKQMSRTCTAQVSPSYEFHLA